MSFGFSPSDVISLINLVTKTYRGWKSACGEYADITESLNALSIILERIDSEARKPKSALVRSVKDAKNLKGVLSNVHVTVRDLHVVVDHYKSLGLKKSRQSNWERICLGVKNLDTLRVKLGQHVATVTAYLEAVGLGSLARIETGLDVLPEIKRVVDALAADLRAGRREGSIMTTYEDDEKEVWKQFRRELIGEGMTSSVIHKHKPRIVLYLRSLAEEGLLEEDAPSEDGSEEQTSVSDNDEENGEHNNPNEDETVDSNMQSETSSDTESSGGGDASAVGNSQLVTTHGHLPTQGKVPDAVQSSVQTIEWQAVYQDHPLEEVLERCRLPTHWNEPEHDYRIIFRDYSDSRSLKRGVLLQVLLQMIHRLKRNETNWLMGPHCMLIRALTDEALSAKRAHRWRCPYPPCDLQWGVYATHVDLFTFESVADLKWHLHSEHKRTLTAVWSDTQSTLRFGCPYPFTIEGGSCSMHGRQATATFEDVYSLKGHLLNKHTSTYNDMCNGWLDSRIRFYCPYPYRFSGEVCDSHPGCRRGLYGIPFGWTKGSFLSVVDLKKHLRSDHLKLTVTDRAVEQKALPAPHSKDRTTYVPMLSMDSRISWYCPYQVRPAFHYSFREYYSFRWPWSQPPRQIYYEGLGSFLEVEGWQSSQSTPGIYWHRGRKLRLDVLNVFVVDGQHGWSNFVISMCTDQISTDTKFRNQETYVRPLLEIFGFRDIRRLDEISQVPHKCWLYSNEECEFNGARGRDFDSVAELKAHLLKKHIGAHRA